MKKFIFIIALLTAVLRGCGTAKNMNLTSYVEEGTGTSINRDKAYDMAVNNALLKITKAHGITVKATEQQEYADTEATHGKSGEVFNYESHASTKSLASIVDYRVVKHKYSKSRFSKKITCTVVVSVPFENVE